MIERGVALLDRGCTLVENVFVAVSGASLILMMVWITADASGRYLFDHPISGTYEFSEEYLMVMLIFLTLSFTYVQGGHVRVTVCLQFIPKAVQRWISIFNGILGLIFFILIVVASWGVAMRALKMSVVSNNILQYPLAPSFFMVPIGSALLSLRIFQSLLGDIWIKKHQGHEIK
ncbi:MAG: TRAP transporter small permease [Syntrophales bacterium]|jgi:TRAP-type C4-dicarboxylate transport system permease small subunit|nr:TRAP transporter small permease [Syntrophales bacterium]